jgi:membrane-bound lytic murein transglycosylase D
MAKSTRKMLLLSVLALSASSATAFLSRAPESAEPSPMESLLSENSALGSSSWDLTVTRNDRVERFIGFLSRGNAKNTRLYLERSGRYAPYIREQLRARGMPEDLVYLAFIESGFTPRAYSRAAASGLWQFIEETGERYGLQVTNYVDERRDPIESTRAALDYLQELHGTFGSWYLAAAAYNTGENRVARILRERVGGRKGDDELFWRIAAYLPRETRDYVPLMLAAGHIGKNPEQFGFAEVEYQAPLAFDTAWVPVQSSLALVAQASGVEESVIRDLNPHLVRGVTPPGRAWAVRVPEESLVSFALNFPTVHRNQVEQEKTRIALAKNSRSRGVKTASVASKSNPSSKSSVRYHRVSRGENLVRIAERYHSSVKRLQSLNSLGRRSVIVPGQKLRVS